MKRAGRSDVYGWNNEYLGDRGACLGEVQNPAETLLICDAEHDGRSANTWGSHVNASSVYTTATNRM
jgi:hypothetical protein